MSVSRGNHRCASPDIGVAPTRSLLPILPRLYGYPRGTATAYAYIEFIAPVGAASSEQLQQHRARVAPLMPSRCDANLAAAGRLPCFARRAGRSPARSAARCRRSRSWRTGGLGEACEGHRHCARVGNPHGERSRWVWRRLEASTSTCSPASRRRGTVLRREACCGIDRRGTV